MELTEGRLAAALRDTWWSLALRGAAAILFGLFCWFALGVELATLVMAFGLYALVDGVLGLISAFSGAREHEPWGLFLIWGLISIAGAAVAFFATNITAGAFLAVVGAWGVARGVVELIGSGRLRKEIDNEWMLPAAGVASLALGILLWLRTQFAEINAIWVLGTYSLVWGALSIGLSMKAKNFAKPAERRVQPQTVRTHR